MIKGKILVAVNDPSSRSEIISKLQDQFDFNIAPDRKECLGKFRSSRYEFTFIDTDMLAPNPGQPNLSEGVAEFKTIFPTAEIVAVCPPEKVADAVNAVNAGASSYLTTPIVESELRLVINTIRETQIVQGELAHLRGKFWKTESGDLVRTNNLQMQQILKNIQSVAPTKSTVLLTGETGVGKGIIAALIHMHSSRSGQQFVSIHCGAIPDTLIESELFGHEKGAFTDAVKRKLGKFEIANGGTIFLDEIGTISPMAQIKLLQVLQDKIFTRVGGESSIEADVRIIAATNMSLKEQCAKDRFRTDLYYRLNVFPLEIPPLRERKEDIPLLAETLLEKYNKFRIDEIKGIAPEVMAAFRQYDWPGNIRELENLMERAFILEESEILTASSFPDELFVLDELAVHVSPDASASLAEVRKMAADNVEKEYLNKLLKKNGGRIDKTAKDADITTRQLHKLMKKHNLQKNDYKNLP